MTTLLVANRGEIALRVLRTARRMGMRTVAVYSDADAGAPHVRAADVARRIGAAPAGDSYLRRDAVVSAALQTGAELVHPGYGFLAEDHRFARDCEKSGLVFVGPPSEVLRRVGDKAAAKALAAEAGVPVLPSYAGEDQSDEAFARAAGDVGYPLIVKPAGGGGGKGMAVVRQPEDLAAALSSGRRVATAAFDDERLMIERYLEGPRHVEVQVMADAHGNVVHIGERDCSLQRRHQKILEEAPAPSLDPHTRTELCRAAVDFTRSAGYVGAGTCEFLVGDDGEIGFMEMNARLQVEHPVTESVTGLDLVELQLRVALGERLPLRQEDVTIRGHAVEVRLYAEDPEGFLPQTGMVAHLRWPEDVRVDTGIEEGSEVTAHYDPLLAKIVADGADRTEALQRVRRALGETELLGLRTNLTFLAAITADPVVVSGEVRTDWLERDRAPWRWPERSEDVSSSAAVAAAAELDSILSRPGADPGSALGPWRMGGAGAASLVLRLGGEERVIPVRGSGPYVVGEDGAVSVSRGTGCHGWLIGDGGRAAAAKTGETWHVWIGGAPYEVAVGPSPRAGALAGGGRLESPLPGRVIAVRVRPGETVSEAQELVVVEAMKMEHSIRAPSEGTIRAVMCAVGDHVDRGRALVEIEPA